MQVKRFSVALTLMPLVVNASQVESLPERELLEFLGRYSQEEQTWLELAMEQEQQKLSKDKGSTASVGDSKHD
jgi:hypothetical protein